MAAQEWVVAGDRLASADQYTPADGVYSQGGFIYASIVGVKLITKSEAQQLPTLQVLPSSKLATVPKVGDAVIAKVTRVQQLAANVLVMCVGSKALDQDFKGVIRQQDVRATEVDKVVMYDCFRPGDIIRAEVVSLGDARSLYLSTAKNDLGVVYARSVAGAPMVPESWTEMRCPETHTLEKRKVAQQQQQQAAAAAK